MPVLADKIFANLGCGPKGSRRPPLFEGWSELRVDIEPDVDPDILADITDLSAIPSNSVHGAWSSHCVEHLYQHQVGPALAEIHRILHPEGFVCILVPDLQTIASYIAADKMHEPLYESPAGPITPHDVVFGFGREIAKGYTYMAHRCGFTPSAMVEHLQAAQFGQFLVMRRPNFELAVLAHKTTWASDAEREALAQQLRL